MNIAYCLLPIRVFSWLLSGLLLSIIPGRAFAHAELVAAEPAAGAAVTGSLDEIRLTFSEPVATGSAILLFRDDFESVAGVAAQPDPQAPEQLVATVPELEPGRYTVQWTAVSADGHEVSGSYTFTILVAERPIFTSPWLLLIGLLVIVGAAFLWRRLMLTSSRYHRQTNEKRTGDSRN